jgi:hypothetical protein
MQRGEGVELEYESVVEETVRHRHPRWSWVIVKVRPVSRRETEDGGTMG